MHDSSYQNTLVLKLDIHWCWLAWKIWSRFNITVPTFRFIIPLGNAPSGFSKDTSWFNPRPFHFIDSKTMRQVVVQKLNIKNLKKPCGCFHAQKPSGSTVLTYIHFLAAHSVEARSCCAKMWCKSIRTKFLRFSPDGRTFVNRSLSFAWVFT